jgi:hypothetical protein
MGPVETPTIMQGLGHVAQVISGGIQEGRAQRDESAARDALAKIQATVGLEGAIPAQLAEIGRYDPEIAQQYREEAVQARRDAAARRGRALRASRPGSEPWRPTAGNSFVETSRSNGSEGIQTGQLAETAGAIGNRDYPDCHADRNRQAQRGRQDQSETELAAEAAHNKAPELSLPAHQ